MCDFCYVCLGLVLVLLVLLLLVRGSGGGGGGRAWLRCECGSCPHAKPNLEAVI